TTLTRSFNRVHPFEFLLTSLTLICFEIPLKRGYRPPINIFLRVLRHTKTSTKHKNIIEDTSLVIPKRHTAG
ncbi:hypothetical protein KAS24_03490, partial [Candidatus Bathyarchaeota archaeon]|nr:hypothetical protein [Candidatus Bathyarchaeota archaeon]